MSTPIHIWWWPQPATMQRVIACIQLPNYTTSARLSWVDRNLRWSRQRAWKTYRVVRRPALLTSTFTHGTHVSSYATFMTTHFLTEWCDGFKLISWLMEKVKLWTQMRMFARKLFGYVCRLFHVFLPAHVKVPMDALTFAYPLGDDGACVWPTHWFELVGMLIWMRHFFKTYRVQHSHYFKVGLLNPDHAFIMIMFLWVIVYTKWH